jgi:hypothetical protein
VRTALLLPDKLDLRAVAARHDATPDFWGDDLGAFARHLVEACGRRDVLEIEGMA